jgi:hypothetical protein
VKLPGIGGERHSAVMAWRLPKMTFAVIGCVESF